VGIKRTGQPRASPRGAPLIADPCGDATPAESNVEPNFGNSAFDARMRSYWRRRQGQLNRRKANHDDSR
jgi:hypothetical protein